MNLCIKDDNGLNPVWSSETFVFNISFPELAFIRFLVSHRDTFDDSSFVGQATYPITCLRQGLHHFISLYFINSVVKFNRLV